VKPLPNLRQLRYLAALAEHLHFGHAAAACRVTQSTLSAGIRELETTLGVALAERTKRSVLITPVGRRVVERARILLRDAEELVEIGSAAARPLSGRLDLGVIPTIGPFLLPRLMPQIGRHYPELKLILREDKTTGLLEQLANGRLDLLLMGFPYETEGCETMMLFADGYRFACDPHHPLAKARRVGAEDLQHHPLMLLEKDNCLHSHALPLFEAVPRWRDTSFSATSLHTLVAMVAEGLGATLLPEIALSAGILQSSKVVTRPLADGADARQIGLCWRKQSARAEEFRQLGGLIRDWAKAHLG
jgi:LysR family hydrogen peroxide-inducible transcriptional activator